VFEEKRPNRSNHTRILIGQFHAHRKQTREGKTFQLPSRSHLHLCASFSSFGAWLRFDLFSLFSNDEGDEGEEEEIHKKIVFTRNKLITF
jgi:hypothetical protein